MKLAAEILASAFKSVEQKRAASSNLSPIKMSNRHGRHCPLAFLNERLPPKTFAASRRNVLSGKIQHDSVSLWACLWGWHLYRHCRAIWTACLKIWWRGKIHGYACCHCCWDCCWHRRSRLFQTGLQIADDGLLLLNSLPHISYGRLRMCLQIRTWWCIQITWRSINMDMEAEADLPLQNLQSLFCHLRCCRWRAAHQSDAHASR